MPYIVLNGQESRLANRAKKFYENYHYVDAIEKYQRLLEMEENASSDVYQRLANTYYYIGDYASASKYYAELYKLDSIEFKHNDFKYGQSLKSVERYAKASLYLGSDYAKSKELYGFPPNLNSGKKMYYDVRLCEPCNTRFSEFPTFLEGNHLYIAGPNKWGLHTNSVNGLPTYDIYKLTGDVKKRVEKINSKFNEGWLTISQDKSILYFTSNQREKNVIHGTSIRPFYLYRARNNNGKWVDIEKLPFNQLSYNTLHPALSKDGTELFFVSDMPHLKAKGGMDIYKVAVLANGDFGPVKNVSALNTVGNESYPFISEDGSLYLASDGWPGFGGDDIFEAVMDDKGDYGSPLNLGKEINSNMDDFAFVVNNEGIGYFASNRLEWVNDEIFRFSSKPIQLDPLEESYMIEKIGGVVQNGESDLNLSGIKIEVLDKNNKILGSVLTDEEGRYEFFNIDASKAAYFTIKGMGFEPIEMYLPQDMEVQSDFNFSLKRKRISEIVYFDFDKAELGFEAKKVLRLIVQMLNKFPKVWIRLSGHTDSVGSHDYNMILSKSRVDAVRNYFLDMGVDLDRFRVESFGESKLLDASCIGSCKRNRAVVISLEWPDTDLKINKN